MMNITLNLISYCYNRADIVSESMAQCIESKNAGIVTLLVFQKLVKSFVAIGPRIREVNCVFRVLERVIKY